MTHFLASNAPVFISTPHTKGTFSPIKPDTLITSAATRSVAVTILMARGVVIASPEMVIESEFVSKPHVPCQLQDYSPTSEREPADMNPEILIIHINVVPDVRLRSGMDDMIILKQFISLMWMSFSIY